MNRPKPINLDTAFEVALVLLVVVFLIWNFGFSHPLDRYLPDFDAESAELCYVLCWEWGNGKSRELEYSFDPQSDEYEGLIELLHSTKYRRHFSNVLPDDHSHSISIDPSADIYIRQAGTVYSFSLYGDSMAIGDSDQDEFTPRGGKAFQESVVAYVMEHGTLTEINEY
ncbi:MAG: hypothetical protein ACOX81_01940 [Candidatus Heteroscillospira sp.]|jgi:hypothetical protein